MGNLLEAGLYRDGDEIRTAGYRRVVVPPDRWWRVRDSEGVWGYTITVAWGPYVELAEFDRAVILHDDVPIASVPLDETAVAAGGTFRCQIDVAVDEDVAALDVFLEALVRRRNWLALMERDARRDDVSPRPDQLAAVK